jgi:hypothetical protein
VIFIELVWLKWHPPLVDEGRNIVFDSFGNVLNFFLFQNPFLVFLCSFQIESFHIDQVSQVNFRISGGDNLGVLVDGFQVYHHFLQLFFGHQVNLVDNNEVGNFQLVYH